MTIFQNLDPTDLDDAEDIQAIGLPANPTPEERAAFGVAEDTILLWERICWDQENTPDGEWSEI